MQRLRFELRGPGFRASVWGLGFRVSGLGFRVWGRAWGLELGFLVRVLGSPRRGAAQTASHFRPGKAKEPRRNNDLVRIRLLFPTC